MKKFSLIISVLALVMGLSQCQKRPNAPVFGAVPSTKTITFTTNGGGNAKGNFDQNGGELNYAWSMGDVLYVYVQGEGSEFTDGNYLGEMHPVSITGKYSATFQGTFTASYPETGWIRFVHCGTAVNVNVEEGASDVVDFSTQDGSIATVSSKVIAICDQKITDGCTYNFEDCSLAVQFGVVKFSFGKFEGNSDVTLSEVAETGLKLNANGTVTYKAGTASTLGNMSANKTAYYTVLMPKDETTYKFTCGGQSATKKAKIEAGVFYSRKYEAGEPVVLDVLPEGSLPGEFSVSETEKIRFSKGNLYYDNSESKWRFEEKRLTTTANIQKLQHLKTTGDW
ncbi:MAG: hypothetical protein Q4F69_06760 [Bacteroidia bacterium]|nr:hypothetical protein [Bacteroidia bacterium]